MPLQPYITPHRLGTIYREADRTTVYWLREGVVHFAGHPIRGADPDTFVFYMGGFARDIRHCYCTSARLRDANPETFRALNYTYAADDSHVWTIGGPLPDVDAASFSVCDRGVHVLVTGREVPYGFGKDAQRVYYYDFDGKPNWVRKADATTFYSLGDGYFGRDRSNVFAGTAALPRVNVDAWRLIGGYYSTDGARVYYFNRVIRGAEADTFVYVPTPKGIQQLGRDRFHCYANDRVIEESAFMDLLAKY